MPGRGLGTRTHDIGQPEGDSVPWGLPSNSVWASVLECNAVAPGQGEERLLVAGS